MSATPDPTERLARALLAVETAQLPDDATVEAVRRQLEAVRTVLRHDAADAPNMAAILRAQAIFPTAPSRSQAQPRPIQRLRAALSFDSRQAQPGFGYRGGRGATLLRYEVDGLLVDLEVQTPMTAAAATVTVTGQIDGHADDPMTISLWAVDGDIAWTGGPDDLGSFSLAVAPGRYDLVARFQDTELIVPGIDLE